MNVPTMDLSGKVAIVTGSTRGIGFGIAYALASAGANLVIVSRNQTDCERAAESVRGLDREVLPVAADLTRLDDINRLANTAMDRFGFIDILVNNAGTASTKRAEDITEEEWDHILNLDLKSVFFCSQAVGRHMIKQQKGKIINIASISGLVGDRQVLPYCAAKGGVVQITKALALEWARHNIQVNALCPGYVKTSMNKKDLAQEKIYDHIISKIAMRRLGEVSDLMGAAQFLASEASNYMTGQTMVIDGGWTAE